MAITAITLTSLTRGTAATFPTAQANDTTLGTSITPTRADQKLLIYIQNTDSSNAEIAKIRGGNGPLASSDLSISMAASAIKVIEIESGPYMKNDGKIYLQAYEADGTTASDDIKYAAIQLA